MNKTDIEIWLRIYLPSGGDTDVRFRPLEYRSFGDWQDAVTETLEELSFVDYEVIIWDLIGQSDAHAIYQDESVWDKWNDLFDVAKEYGVPAETIVKAADDLGYTDDYQDFMENAYQGEARDMVSFAVDLLEDIGIDKDLAERYFGFDQFGQMLKIDGVLYDVIGDLNEALGDRVSDYFDYQSFARDLGYDGYDIVDGYVFRAY